MLQRWHAFLLPLVGFEPATLEWQHAVLTTSPLGNPHTHTHTYTHTCAAKDPRRIESKMDRLAVATKGLILEDSANVDPKDSDESERVLQLKEKFRETTKRSEQVQILTVLPKSWTRKRIQNEFGVSEYMARKCKQLVREKGVLSSPDPKPGHSLPSATLKKWHSSMNPMK